jgi:hypothetical protein
MSRRIYPPPPYGVVTSTDPGNAAPASVVAVKAAMATLWGAPYPQLLSPAPAGCCLVRVPLTSADHARERLRWCVTHDRVTVPSGRWHLTRERPGSLSYRGPIMLRDVTRPTGYFRGRDLSLPEVAAEFHRWLKPRYRWRWRR